jgi:hypothetical protein
VSSLNGLKTFNPGLRKSRSLPVTSVSPYRLTRAGRPLPDGDERPPDDYAVESGPELDGRAESERAHTLMGLTSGSRVGRRRAVSLTGRLLSAPTSMRSRKLVVARLSRRLRSARSVSMEIAVPVHAVVGWRSNQLVVDAAGTRFERRPTSGTRSGGRGAALPAAAGESPIG